MRHAIELPGDSPVGAAGAPAADERPLLGILMVRATLRSVRTASRRAVPPDVREIPWSAW